MSRIEEKDCTRIYLRRGAVAHLRAPFAAPWDALCGREHPEWPDVWFGTGGQREYEHAAGLPACRRCLAKLAERHLSYAWLPEAVRLYSRRGRTAHLRPPGAVAANWSSGVECGAWPDGGRSGWLGTGSDEEREHAKSLKLCRKCLRSLAEYYSEPCQWSPCSRSDCPDHGTGKAGDS